MNNLNRTLIEEFTKANIFIESQANLTKEQQNEFQQLTASIYNKKNPQNINDDAMKKYIERTNELKKMNQIIKTPNNTLNNIQLQQNSKQNQESIGGAFTTPTNQNSQIQKPNQDKENKIGYQIMKKGQIQVIKGVLNQWKTRYLNILENYIAISHSPEDEIVTLLNLHDYKIEWEGHYKKKFSFTLELKPEKHNDPHKKNSKYKKLILGDIIELDIKCWYQTIKYIMEIDQENFDNNQVLSKQIPNNPLINLIKSNQKVEQQIEEISIPTENNKKGNSDQSAEKVVFTNNEEAITEVENEKGLISKLIIQQQDIRPMMQYQNKVNEHCDRSADEISEIIYFNSSTIEEYTQIFPPQIEDIIKDVVENIQSSKFIEESSQYSKIVQIGNSIIYKNKLALNTFKVESNLKQKPEFVLQVGWLDIHTKSEWYNRLENVEHQPLSGLYSCFNTEKIRSIMNQNIMEIEYKYLRYTLAIDGVYYVIDKTVKDNNSYTTLIPSVGLISHRIFRVEPHPTIYKQCKVSYEITLDNSNQFTNDFNEEVVRIYLSFLPNFEQFILVKDCSNAVINETSTNSPKIEQGITNSGQIQYFNYSPDKIDLTTFQDCETITHPNNENQIDKDEYSPKTKQSKSVKFTDNKIIQLEPGMYNNENIVKTSGVDTNKSLLKKPKPQEIPVDQLLEMIKKNKHVNLCIVKDDILWDDPTLGRGRIVQTTEEKGHFIFKYDWARDENGGLEFINKQLISKQKGIISYILRQIGTNILKGKGIMNMSLPVGIFEPRSYLERMADTYCFAPVYFDKASTINDPLEQFKLALAYQIGTLCTIIKQEKPFNPILGETYQGSIDGNSVYVEQISHHPPISMAQLYGKGYKINGILAPVAEMGANSLIAKTNGYTSIIFENTKSAIYLQYPHLQLTGISFGKRIANFQKKAYAYYEKFNYFCEMTFNLDNKRFFGGMFNKNDMPNDYFDGIIYQVKPSFIEKISEKYKHSKEFKFNPREDAVKEITTLKGIWTSYLEIDGKRYWDMEVQRPYEMISTHKKLPSDSTFRQDLIYLKLGDEINAQKFKEQLEKNQRDDKKTREKNGKKH